MLGIPCLTARPSTGRPVTITEGTNRLIPSTREDIREGVAAALAMGRRANVEARRPPLWDGRAGCRIVAALAEEAGGLPKRGAVS